MTELDHDPTESASTSGLRDTLIERFFASLPGPFALWVFVLAFVFGTPGFIVARLLDTGSVGRALSLFEPTLESVVTYGMATFGLTLYALLGLRFMRSRTAAASRALEPLIPGGRSAMERALAPVTSPIPPLVLTPILLAVSFVAYPDQVQDITGIAYGALRIVSLPIVYFVYATFIWVYLSSVMGLDTIARGPLRLRSFLEDSHFGVRPIASLSLFLALVYFLGLGLVVFSFLELPLVLEALLAALALPGVVLFFLPVARLRARMSAARAEAGACLAEALAKARPFLEAGTPAGRVDAPDAVAALLAYQIIEHRVGEVGEWPLDTRTVSWFSAIVLSVLAAIATRYVLAGLGA